VVSAAEAAVWESCMRGPPSDLAVLGASHVSRSGEDPTSNPTDVGTTSGPIGGFQLGSWDLAVQHAELVA
jgi:hypothetical protein